MLKTALKVITALIGTNARVATFYLTPSWIVRATRILYRGKISMRGNVAIRLTIGRPNYSERAFIAKCKKAGEPFPVKKIQFKFPAKR